MKDDLKVCRPSIERPKFIMPSFYKKPWILMIIFASPRRIRLQAILLRYLHSQIKILGRIFAIEVYDKVTEFDVKLRSLVTFAIKKLR